MTKAALLRPLVAAVSAALVCGPAWGNPTGAQVVNGAVTMQRPDARTLNVTNSPGSIINWQGFSIGAGEITRFIQQSSSSAVLNRVVGADISQIQGQLLSNGRVFLINPAGILIGGGAVIDTAGFVASTLNMSNADFLAGKLRFEGDASAGSIVNQGWIKTSAGGNVVFVAPKIENSGLIETPGGELILAAGQKVTIASLDHEGVQFEVQAPTDSVLNVGKLIADGGAVGVFAGTLKHSGDIRANALTRDEAGRIVLKAQDNITLAVGSTTRADGRSGGNIAVQSGDTTLVSGDISATGSEGRGGTIQILGNKVGVTDHALVNASGDTGGGVILVGGDLQGKNPDVLNAWRTFAGPDVALRADAITSGDGGKIIVWADDITRVYSAISARGGATSGNGGFVETSGKQWMDFATLIDTSAPHGRVGTWLADPAFIEITDVAGQGQIAYTPAASLFGTNPTLTTRFFATAAGGANSISVQSGATSPVLQANSDITFTSAINMVSTSAPIIAQAGRSILVNASITTNNSDITLTANDPSAQSGNRAAGDAHIIMAAGTTLAAGNGNITLSMGSGVGGAGNTSGNIVVNNATTTGAITIFHNGQTANGKILRVDGTSLLTGGNNVHMEIENSTAGPTSSIGLLNEPMRIQTPIVQAHYHNAQGGIYIDSPNVQDVQVGNAAFGGQIKGIQTLSAAGAAGPIVLSVNGTLTQLVGAATCGSSGASGGPICAGASGSANAADILTLRAVDMVFDQTSGALAGNKVILVPRANGTISPGSGGAGGSLHLANGEIARITARTLQIGELTTLGDGDPTSSGAMTFAGGITAPAANTVLDFRTGGAITAFGGTDITSAGADVKVHGHSIGVAGAGGAHLTINPSTGHVTAGSTGGNIAIEQPSATLVSTYTFVPSAGATVDLAANGGNLTVDTDVNLPGNLTILNARGGGGNIIFTNNATVTTGTLELIPTGSSTFNSGSTVINAILDTARPVVVNGGNVNFNNGGSLTAGGTLTVANGTATFNNQPMTVNDDMTVNGTGVVAGNAQVNAPLVANGLTFGGTGLISNSAGVIVAGQTLVSGTPQVTGRLDTGSLFLPAGAVLTSSGTLNLTGAVDSQINGLNARVNNSGTFRLTSTGNLGINANGTFQNSGTFDIQTDAGITSAILATFTNSGTLTKSGGTGTSTLGSGTQMTFSNTGTLNVSSGVLQMNANFPQNNGTIRVGTGTTFHMASGDLMNHGTIAGTGTISITGGTNTLVNENIVAPGASPGTLTIAGNYTQAANGVLEVELAGLSQGTTYDLLDVTGNVTLGGTLRVRVDSGFGGAVGNNFDIIGFGGPAPTTNFSTFDYQPGYTFSNTLVPNFYRLGLLTVPITNDSSSVITEQERMRDTLQQDRMPEEEKKPQTGLRVCS